MLKRSFMPETEMWEKGTLSCSRRRQKIRCHLDTRRNHIRSCWHHNKVFRTSATFSILWGRTGDASTGCWTTTYDRGSSTNVESTTESYTFCCTNSWVAIEEIRQNCEPSEGSERFSSVLILVSFVIILVSVVVLKKRHWKIVLWTEQQGPCLWLVWLVNIWTLRYVCNVSVFLRLSI